MVELIENSWNSDRSLIKRISTVSFINPARSYLIQALECGKQSSPHPHLHSGQSMSSMNGVVVSGLCKYSQLRIDTRNVSRTGQFC